ncbi:unnamed protein product, partial [Anisakis simplex]|uniref:DUF998 domain-containing protein n=1 Tax=Anisakis simplex TaxID=6269 RepID=A0A0M3KKA4_ANISI
MGQTWYLAVDWQIHVFSPLLIVPLFLSLKAGCVVAFLLIALSTVANYITFYHFDSPASYVGLFGDAMDPEKTANYTQNVYFAPWLRFTPYVIGVFTGYFLQKTRGKQLHLHWAIAVALWIASILTGIACVYGLYDYLQGPEHEISLAARSSYYNWSRIAWALALAWVVIACQNDWAGKIFTEFGYFTPFLWFTFYLYAASVSIIIII